MSCFPYCRKAFPTSIGTKMAPRNRSSATVTLSNVKKRSNDDARGDTFRRLLPFLVALTAVVVTVAVAGAAVAAALA